MSDNNESPDYKTIAQLALDPQLSLLSLEQVKSDQKPHVVVITIFAVFLISTISALFAPWVQTVQGKGRTITYSPNERPNLLEAPIDGRISHWFVFEGAHVKKGDPIVELVDIDPKRHERLLIERDAVKTKFLAAEHALDTSIKNLVRQERLRNKGLSSHRTYELAALEVNKFRSELSSATGELARMETQLSRQESQRVLAPKDGTVMSITTPQGGVFVKVGDHIATLVPETEDRAVELLIKGNDMPLLAKGRHVRLQFEGWPAIQFSGWPSVAVGTFGGEIAFIDPGDDGKGNFRIIVIPDKENPWPPSQFLRQGVRAVGWVILDEVRLGWELWRQFNAFPITVKLGSQETSTQAKPSLK